jgi:hypothetical protein
MLKCTTALAAICLGLASSPLLAQTASSSGYAVDVDQTVNVPILPDVNVGIGPLASASGSAPAPYDTTNTVLSVNNNAALIAGLLGINQQLQTSVLITNVNGTATGAEATSTVNDLSLSIAGLASLFNLSATTIQSYSQANSVGGLDASGTTTIEGLNLGGTLLGALLIDSSLFVNPAPNTILFSGGGLSIILNEQIALGDGLTSIGIETNAIHIGLDNFLLGTGLVDGDIIIGHSQAFATIAQAAAVPEPSTWAMMLLGFGAIGFRMRRRGAMRLRSQAA